jgi:hypothetical protein
MAILQAVLAMVFRQAGRFLNTAFGWATTLLFGKVPEKRQVYLSAIAFGSVLWMIVVLGVAFPSVGTFLLAFVPLPEWVSPMWVRLAMLGAALVLPAFVGGISLFLADPAERPKGVGPTLKAICKGYPYTLGLALTLIMMLLVAPALKMRDVVRRWTSKHIPVVVESGDYFSVLQDIQRVLRRGGFETSRTKASLLLRGPTKVFTLLAGSAVDDLVAEELTTLVSPNIEVLLHPSDLVIRGREKDVSRAHALVTEHLTFTKAYLTWTKDAQEMEDRLGKLWRHVKAGADSAASDPSTELAGIESDLKTLNLTYEEWEVLFREKLIVERAMLRAMLRSPSGTPIDALEWDEPVDAESRADVAAPARPHSAIESLVGGIIALVALWRSAFNSRRSR